jgi:protein-tyrosine-phosphatase/DNA-binding transcriptional ArsR family regulator
VARTRHVGEGTGAERLLIRRARMHAALGEPVRLAMVERLAMTDASPGELGATYGLGTNLLAHHVKALQDAGLVRRVKSEGDARRAYLQLCLDDPEVVRALGGQVPASPVAPSGGHVPGTPERVLFVCTQNSARSQLAAAAWRRVSSLPATSAGTQPASRVHPRAVSVGRRHHLRLNPGRTANLADVAAPGDLVVCVCDNAYEELAAAAGQVTRAAAVGTVHWAVPDPVRVDTDEAFETAYVEIAVRVERLARSLPHSP